MNHCLLSFGDCSKCPYYGGDLTCLCTPLDVSIEEMSEKQLISIEKGE